MDLLRNAGTAILSVAYVALLAAVGLWLAEYARPTFRAQAVIRALAWAAAALVAAHLLVSAALQRRPLFVAAPDFLAAGTVGMLALAPLAGRGRASPVGPLVLALAALGYVLTARPADLSAAPAQQTLVYALQAALHALGVGGCMAALLGALGDNPTQQERPLARTIGIALWGTGLVLSSAWAWLNWGAVWRNDPRLNFMAAGWLCVVAGEVLRRGTVRWTPAVQWLGIALMLVGVFAADLIAAGWPGLPFVAW